MSHFVHSASYYVTAQLAETLADAATSLSGNYSTGGNSYTSTGHLVSNGSLSSAYYNDAASYQRLDVEFDGLLAGSHDEQSIAHTFNHTLSEGVGMAWDVDLTRMSGTSTLTAYYSGSANSGTFAASDYYRTFEATDIVIPEGEVEIHWTRIRQTGVYRYDDWMGFNQRQDWDGGDGGYRDGEGGAADYNAGAFAGDAGDYNGNPFGDVWANNQVVESGNADPIAFSVEWSSEDTSSVAALPPSGLGEYFPPAGGKGTASITTFHNYYTVKATRTLQAFGREQLFYKEKLTRDAEDKLVTSKSAGATGTSWQRAYLSLSVSQNHSGSSSVNITATAGTYGYYATGDALTTDVIDGDLFTRNDMRWTATHLWTDSGGATINEVDLWELTANAWLDQSRSVAYNAHRNGTGTISQVGGGGYSYTHTGNYEDDSDRNGNVAYSLEASATRTPSNPTAGWTVGADVRQHAVTASRYIVTDYSHSATSSGGSEWQISDTYDVNQHIYTTAGATAQDRFYTNWTTHYTYGPPGAGVGDSFTDSATSSTPFNYNANLPAIGSPIGAGLVSAALKPPLSDALDYLEENSLTFERKVLKDALLSGKLALKNAGSALPFDAMAAKTRLRHGLPDNRENPDSHPAQANAAQQGAAKAPEIAKPKTGSQAEQKRGQITKDKLTGLVGPNGGNPKALDPGEESGTASIPPPVPTNGNDSEGYALRWRKYLEEIGVQLKRRKEARDPKTREQIDRHIEEHRSLMRELDEERDNQGATDRATDRLEFGPGDEARFMSRIEKFVRLLKWGLANGKFEGEAANRIRDFVDTLQDPVAAAEFAAIIGAGLLIKKGACGKSWAGPAGLALTAGELAVVALKFAEMDMELGTISFESELNGDRAERVIALSADILMDAAFFEWMQKFVCFGGDTLIETARGRIRFDELQVGDLVKSRPEDAGDAEPTWRAVETIFKSTTPAALDALEFDDQTIHTTGGHPFYVQGKGWTAARDLQPGDLLRTADAWIELRQRIANVKSETVYNCRVVVDQTYFVAGSAAAIALWAHNQCKKKRVYQLSDDSGNVNYVGETSDARRRSNEHRNDPNKAGSSSLRTRTDDLTHDEARTIEAKLIRRRLQDAQKDGLIDGTESIADQLRKAGLQNKNRGRDPSRWLDIEPDDFLLDGFGEDFSID